MNINFKNLFVDRNHSLSIRKQETEVLQKCWFAGESKLHIDNFIHFATFSKECFSEKENQVFISIFVNPNSPLPEWKAVETPSANHLENVYVFNLNLEKNSKEAFGTKIGGTPSFMRTAQANLLIPELEKKNLKFVIAIDEEDFFPLKTQGITKEIRDCLCGGIIYIFGVIKESEEYVEFREFLFDHQI